ncbi:MAG TPA: amidohydrolase family protein [Dehalococcoidia bacterium]|nr:amidohydrolase family protein [Dehalococcoidia bacterium]
MSATVLLNGTLIDGTGRDPVANAAVVINGGNITAAGPADGIARPPDAQVIDLDGRTIMPGLMDAHVHLGIVDLSVSSPQRDSLAVWAMKVKQNIEDTLDAGITTVRDAAGIDGGFAKAVEDSLLRGPRILPSGSAISQTGGHGDWRPRFADSPQASIPGLAALPAICDSPDEVRRAVRQNLRLGATQIKIMASGGAMSPADELEATQLTVDEIAAAVHEAEAAGKYVMAHVYTPRAIANCLAGGVRSIEHGNLLDEEQAAEMKKRGAYLVPTITTYDLIDRFGAQYGIPEFNLEKIRLARTGSFESVRIAMAAGVKIGSGSDLLAQMQPYKTMELPLKTQVMTPMEAIVSATRTNAELFRLQNRTGTLESGKWADVIVVQGNPLDDINCLVDKNNVKLVLKQGAVLKNTLP